MKPNRSDAAYMIIILNEKRGKMKATWESITFVSSFLNRRQNDEIFRLRSSYASVGERDTVGKGERERDAMSFHLWWSMVISYSSFSSFSFFMFRLYCLAFLFFFFRVNHEKYLFWYVNMSKTDSRLLLSLSLLCLFRCLSLSLHFFSFFFSLFYLFSSFDTFIRWRIQRNLTIEKYLRFVRMSLFICVDLLFSFVILLS